MRKRTALTASLIAMLSVAGVAQLVPSSQEQIHIPVGAIFEIQAVQDGPAQYSWTLTQGQQFIEASRTHIFQTRFTQAGTYTLLGQLGDESGNLTYTRTFQLNVQPRKPEDNSAALNPETGVSDLVTFMPALSAGEIRLNAERQVLEVRHARTDISVIAIDLNTEKDANGDGVTANDDDTRDTLFRTNPNPLHLWFASQKNQTLKAGALLSDNTTKFQDFVIRFGNEPLPGNIQQPTIPEIPTGDGEIVVLKSDNGTLQFAVRLQSAQNTPMLYQWKFGDGGQSLLDSPIHTYAESGTYEISVGVRDLKTGKTLSTVRDSIVVNRLRENTGTEEDPPAQKPDSPTKPPVSSESSGLLGMILKALLGLLLSGAAGVGIIFVIGKLKKKNFSLEKTMESAEKTMTGKVASAAPLTMEMPMDDEPLPPTESSVPDIRPNVIDSEPIDVPAEYVVPSMPEANTPIMSTPAEETKIITPHTAMEPSAEQLKADAANAPDWLKAGIETAQVVGQTPTARPPDMLAVDAPPEVPIVPTPETLAVSTEPAVPITPPIEQILPTVSPAEPPVMTNLAQEPEITAEPIITSVPEPAPQATSVLPNLKPATEPLPKAVPVPEPIMPVEPPTQPVSATNAAASTQTPATPDAEREAREREKKRLKRQRYRENKKKRDGESKTETAEPPANEASSETKVDTDEPASDDETVAIIRAENVGISENPPAPTTPPEQKT